MSQSTQHAETFLGVVAKVSPPVGVVAASAAGMTLQYWVWAATLAYTLLMTLKLIWDWLIKPLWGNKK